MTNLEIGQNIEQSKPPYKNNECSGEPAHTTQSDPEPMEAQESEITTQADLTEIITSRNEPKGQSRKLPSHVR